MLEKRTRITIVLIIIILALVAAPGIYRIENGSGGITAMEGRLIADRIAKEWSQNATLCSIDKGSVMEGGGYFQIWGYYYLNGSSPAGETEVIGITVESNGDNSFIHNASMGNAEPINAFSIDSDNAYAIASEIPALDSFLGKNPSVEVFSLKASSGNAVWTIEMVETSIADRARWAQVRIDANTGDILFVHVDD